MDDKSNKDSKVEGEGSYSGTKAYNDATAKFLKKGKVVQFVAKGAGMTFTLGGVPQTNIGVVATVGPSRFCALFGGRITKDDGAKFIALGALPPLECPEVSTTS